MKKKIISIVIMAALIWANCYTVFATTSQEYKKQADAVKASSEKVKEELENVEKELDGALQEVSELSDSIESIETEIGNLTEKMENLKTSIADKESDLKGKEALLDERLTAAYINGGTNPYVEALFSGGFFSFVSNFDMIKQIAEYDNKLINEVKETKTALESEKQQVEVARSEKERKSAELKTLKSRKQEKVNSLTDEQKEMQAKVEEYDEQMKELQKKEKEAAAAEKAAAERAIASASPSSSRSSNSLSSNGRFQWPVPSSSRISSPYGYRIHPIYGTKKLHAGIDIAASSGSNIVAAESGTIILSSWGYNGGYGNYIIINHGNGYTTRYAHCSNLYVKVGDTVSRGQVIAAVGSTGASTGPHCHFEVRINGESKNPVDYL